MAQEIGPFQGAVAWTAADLEQDQTWRICVDRRRAR